MASTEAGHKYMVEEAGMIPAFNSVTLKPEGYLTQSVADWMNSGKIYSWQYTKVPTDFGISNLGPVYDQFVNARINVDEFCDLVKAEVAKIPELLRADDAAAGEDGNEEE
jgi:raffinose/stachyose/melibiose transport system substrate-binding protein